MRMSIGIGPVSGEISALNNVRRFDVDKDNVISLQGLQRILGFPFVIRIEVAGRARHVDNFHP